MFFKLAAAFAGYDFNDINFFGNRVLNNFLNASVDIAAFVENVMQIQGQSAQWSSILPVSGAVLVNKHMIYATVYSGKSAEDCQ